MNNFEFGQAGQVLAIELLREIFTPEVALSSEVKDRRFASDITIKPLIDVPTDVAVRSRRHYPKRFLDNPDWGYQFTIRTVSRSGSQTEIDKILDGFGDYLLYLYMPELGGVYSGYHLIDLDAFRSRHRVGMAGRDFQNWDGTAGIAYDVRAYPDLVTSSIPPKPHQGVLAL